MTPRAHESGASTAMCKIMAITCQWSGTGDTGEHSWQQNQVYIVGLGRLFPLHGSVWPHVHLRWIHVHTVNWSDYRLLAEEPGRKTNVCEHRSNCASCSSWCCVKTNIGLLSDVLGIIWCVSLVFVCFRSKSLLICPWFVAFTHFKPHTPKSDSIILCCPCIIFAAFVRSVQLYPHTLACVKYIKNKYYL